MNTACVSCLIYLIGMILMKSKIIFESLYTYQYGPVTGQYWSVAASIGPLFQKLKVMTIYQLYKYFVGVFTYKSYRNNLPPVFTMFERASNINTYSTRQIDSFCIHKLKTFQYIVATILIGSLEAKPPIFLIFDFHLLIQKLY